MELPSLKGEPNLKDAFTLKSRSKELFICENVHISKN